MMKENVTSLNSQAIEFASKGDFSEAIACFKKAILLEKYNYHLWSNLGITYNQAGKFEESYNALCQAYKINDEDDEVLEMLAIVSMNLGMLDKALEYTLEGLNINDQNPHLWNLLGVVNFNTNNFEDASNAFEQAVTLNPYYYDALYNLRDTYEELGNKAGFEQCMIQMKTIQMKDNSGDLPNA